MDTRKEIEKIVIKDRGISFVKVSATVATAVSTALISAKLTGTVNTIILVAVMSVIGAFASEFYRVVLSITSLGAKKIILNKTLETSSDEEEEEHVEPTDSQLVWSWVSGNTFFKFIGLFLMVGLMTTGASYLVANHFQQPSKHTTTVIQKELPQSEKEEILTEAVDRAKDEVPPLIVQEKTIELKESETNNTESALKELQGQVHSLQSELESVKKSNSAPPEPNNLALDEMGRSMAELQRKVDVLMSELEKMKNSKTQDNAVPPVGYTE